MKKRHRLLRTSIVAGAGAAAMYFADPEQGPTRRAMLRQRFDLWSERAEDLVLNEPMATSDAMVDLRDAIPETAPEVAFVEVITIEDGAPPLPTRDPISDETMTVDEAVFHAARTL
jgi:hypothetical protein